MKKLILLLMMVTSVVSLSSELSKKKINKELMFKEISKLETEVLNLKLQFLTFKTEMTKIKDNNKIIQENVDVLKENDKTFKNITLELKSESKTMEDYYSLKQHLK